MDHVLRCTFSNKRNAAKYFRHIKKNRFHNYIIFTGVFLKSQALQQSHSRKKSIFFFSIHDKWKFSNLLSDERVPRQILSAT